MTDLGDEILKTQTLSIKTKMLETERLIKIELNLYIPSLFSLSRKFVF